MVILITSWACLLIQEAACRLLQGREQQVDEHSVRLLRGRHNRARLRCSDRCWAPPATRASPAIGWRQLRDYWPRERLPRHPGARRAHLPPHHGAQRLVLSRPGPTHTPHDGRRRWAAQRRARRALHIRLRVSIQHSTIHEPPCRPGTLILRYNKTAHRAESYARFGTRAASEVTKGDQKWGLGGAAAATVLAQAFTAATLLRRALGPDRATLRFPPAGPKWARPPLASYKEFLGQCLLASGRAVIVLMVWASVNVSAVKLGTIQ
eukprot:1181946-Prorocentrum_minimum.AAC.5